MQRLISVLFLTVFLVACSHRKVPEKILLTAADSALHREWKPENNQMVSAAVPLLRTGDIALRTGADATSHALRAMNQKSKTYSHCGIVSIEAGRPWIYHSIGGEENPEAKIRRETPEQFFAPLSNEGGGACRYPLTPAQQKQLIGHVQQWHREGRTFDLDFDLATDTQLYCAEFVYKAFLLAGFARTHFSTSHAGGFEYIAVDDLYTHPAAKIICSFRYK